MNFIRSLLFLPPGGSTAARGIDLLHLVVISATMLGSVVVFAVAFYFLVRYPARGGRTQTPRVVVPRGVEVALIAGTLALFLAFWVVGFTQYNRMRVPPRDALVVYVTGRQWMWHFAYADGRSALGTLTVPAHTPVRLVMTSRDVIHSFFVPAFRLKQDVIPGRYVSAWFEAAAPGTYEVLCAEYCGLSHSRMRAQVTVLARAEYAAWLARTVHGGGRDARSDAESSAGAQAPEVVRRGREVAARYRCTGCHTADGQRFIGPTFRGLFGSRVALRDGRSVLADEEYLTRSMMDPQEDLVAGFAPVMPVYRGVLQPEEVGALIEYIRWLQRNSEPAGVALPSAAALPALVQPGAALETDAGSRDADTTRHGDDDAGAARGANDAGATP